MKPAGSTQDQMRDMLSKLGIPSKEIKCYGSQIMITCRGYESARKFAHVLTKFCATVRGPKESLDYNVNQSVNDGLLRAVRTHQVWRVWGTL